MENSAKRLLQAVKHYQDSIQRHSKTGNSEKLVHAIDKLSRLPIQVCHLEETGVGRTVNSLKKVGGKVGENARVLVDKWKSMVKGEEDDIENKQKEEGNDGQIEGESVDEVPEEELPIRDDMNSYNKKQEDEGENSSHKKTSTNDNYHNKTNKEDHGKRGRHHEKSKRRHSHSSDTSNSDSSDDESDHKPQKHKSAREYQKQSHRKNHNNSSDSSSSGSDSDDSSTDRKSSSEDETSKGSSSESSESEDSDKNTCKTKQYASSREQKYNRHNSSESDSANDNPVKEKQKQSKERNNKSSRRNSDENEKKGKHKSPNLSNEHESQNKSKRSKDDRDESKDKYKKHDKFMEQTKSKESRNESNKSDNIKRKNDSSKLKINENDNKHKKNHGHEKSKSEDDLGKDHSKYKNAKSDDSERKSSSSKTSKEQQETSSKSRDKKRSRDSSAERSGKKHKKDDQSKIKSHKSSSYKTKEKQEERNKHKDVKDKPESSSTEVKLKEQRSSSPSAKIKSSSVKSINGIDSESGASFGDVLGMLEPPVFSKGKKKINTMSHDKEKREKSQEKVEKVSKPSTSTNSGSVSTSFKNDFPEPPKLLKEPHLEPLDINISSLLPNITPNYKPLSFPLDIIPKKALTQDEALSQVISAKHQRTKVYSGNKSAYTKVPSLFDMCTRILQDNIDALEYTGGVPYSILKPILEKATPDQLFQLEFHNPYLIEDTDELWQLHCQKEFRNKNRQELETCREMYMRCLDEREAKLKALTANIKQSQDKSIPVRTTKLAYVDTVVKPPRNIARKQAKNGLLVEIKKPTQTPTERLNQLAKSGEAAKVAVPNPGRAAAERSSSSNHSHSSNLKPKKAPLMAKTLSLLKNRFGRR